MNRLITSTAAGLLAALATSGSSLAGEIAHYTFDLDGTATVGTNALLGAAATISSDAAVGSGSLALSGIPALDTLGDDGAVSGNSFDWSVSGTRTVALWMKATAGAQLDANGTLISLGAEPGAGERFDFVVKNDALRLEVQGGGTTTGTIVADGTWHHIAVVVTDPATVASCEYYIDGVSQGTFGGSGTAVITGVGPLRIGDGFHDTTRDFVGNIDDVRLFDTALSAAEIAALVVTEPGVGYCFGDLGSGTACPCGNDNDGSAPGSGCANGQNPSGALLDGSGTASLSNDTVVLAAHQAVGGQPGLYFQADNDLSPGLIFGDGLRCAGGSVQRLGVRAADTAGDSDTSSWTTSISTRAGNILPGDTKRYQLWYRDPFSSPCGSLFNLSNGYAITWAP
jgi:hypothetical protein